MQHHRAATQPFHVSLRRLTPLLPGILPCAAVSCAAILAETFQARLVGHAWLGDLVLAILFGTALRSLITLPAVASAGIKFSAKTLLEIAVALLGASLSLSILKGAGGLLIGGIALIVALACCQLFRRTHAGVATEAGDFDCLRQLDLWQLGHRGGGTRHRRET